MESKLIILRGNSGSGKTTVAKMLRDKLGSKTMLISQDVIRREVLKVKDDPNNPAIELIKHMALFGNNIGYNVIIEGIFSKKKYGKMISELTHVFRGRVNPFYFDISFDETLRRHQLKPNKHEFGEKEMREWWKEKDYLGFQNEKFITTQMTQEDALTYIYNSSFEEV